MRIILLRASMQHNSYHWLMPTLGKQGHIYYKCEDLKKADGIQQVFTNWESTGFIKIFP